eukprot:TRINITY_DN10442_c0_g2_i3.p1 TRINITY_DN10442_c0_g2~~TRINITY_DN10442_c0_g2_i3.p1  ORF type:complete len:310 (+),score=19.50 TRINITY_DN10442_c0_g2_i3:388-1317(+)
MIEVIGRVFEENTTLLELDIKELRANFDTLDNIIKTSETLTSLIICNERYADTNIELIGRALAANRALSHLTLIDKAVTNERINTIIASLVVNKKLTHLILRGRSLGHVGNLDLEIVSTAFKVNHSLRVLNLERMYIKVEGAKAIGTALEVNGSLQVLNLRMNNILDEGAKAIGVALKRNKALTQLHLGYNYIYQEGADAIIARTRQQLYPSSRHFRKMLKLNKTLTHLNISQNNTDDGRRLDIRVKAIAEALGINTALVTLDLRENNISSEEVEELSKGLKAPMYLSLIHICRCRRYAVCRSRWSPYH